MVSFVRLSTTLIWKLSPCSKRVGQDGAPIRRRASAYHISRDERTGHLAVHDDRGASVAIGGDVGVGDGEVRDRADSSRSEVNVGEAEREERGERLELGHAETTTTEGCGEPGEGGGRTTEVRVGEDAR